MASRTVTGDYRRSIGVMRLPSAPCSSVPAAGVQGRYVVDKGGANLHAVFAVGVLRDRDADSKRVWRGAGAVVISRLGLVHIVPACDYGNGADCIFRRSSTGSLGG